MEEKLMKYDFDTVYQRLDSEKWGELQRKFGTDQLIAFWEADMDFKSAQPILDAVRGKAEEGIFGYVHIPDSYHQSIVEWVSRRHGFELRPDWIVHTPMVITAVTIYLRLVASPGDGVVLMTPLYYPFYSTVEGLGLKILRSPMVWNGQRHEIDFDDLEHKITSGAKALVLCNPQNPGGTVWTREDLLKVGKLCLENGVKVIADEAHADFAFGQRKYTPFASLDEEFARESMTLLSPGKTFNLAGTKQAVVVIPDEEVRRKFCVETELLDIDRNNCFSAAAVEAGYRYGEEWFNQVTAYIEANMDYAVRFFKERIPRIKATKPDGTYLMWLDCRALGLNGEALEQFMVHQAGVGMGEGRWFGPEAEGFERMNVACPRAILQEGLERLERAVTQM